MKLDEYPFLSDWFRLMCDNIEVKQALRRIQEATAEQDPEAARAWAEARLEIIARDWRSV